MVIFREELIVDVLEEIIPLTQMHYKEIAMHQDKIELDPDYSQYIQLNGIDACRLYTARDEDTNELLGYSIVLINPHIHYKQDIFAGVDVVYLDKSIRGKLYGLNLFRYVEDRLNEIGVSVITYHVKVTHDFSTLMKRLGYEFSEKIYSKCIK